MSEDRHLPLPAKSIVAVILVLVCIMFFMEWTIVAFRGSGYGTEFIRYATRIVGLPVLCVLVWLIVREHRGFIRELFARHRLSLRLVATAIAVGLLARVFWWSQLISRIAFGQVDSSYDSPPHDLSIAFSCPELPILAMAIVVWWILVPVVEEFVHRGVFMSALSNRGPLFAVAVSALVFAIMHRFTSIPFAFAFGVVFGILFWNARTLWAPIIAHATYDGLLVLDWICLKTSWNPSPSDLPLTALGTGSALVAVACASGIAFLISARWVGLPAQSNPS